MKEVIWTDKEGLKHRSQLRDTDPVSSAPIGIPLDPPNLDLINWDHVKRDVHNALIDLHLHTWRDVQNSRNGVSSAILTALRRRIITLYKQQEQRTRSMTEQSKED